MEQQESKIFESFSNFNYTQWLIWMDSLLSNKPLNPSVALPDLAPDGQLIHIRNIIRQDKELDDKFAKGGISLLNQYCKSRNNVSGIYFLLQLFSVIGSEKYAYELETLFTNEDFKELSYDDINLHILAFNVLIEYYNTTNLSGYLQRDFENSEENIQILLSGLRYYYKRDFLNYDIYLSTLLIKIENEEENSELCKEVINSFDEMVFYKNTIKPLFAWWKNKYTEINFKAPKTISNLSSELLKWLKAEHIFLLDFARIFYYHILSIGELSITKKKIAAFVFDTVKRMDMPYDEMEIRKEIMNRFICKNITVRNIEEIFGENEEYVEYQSKAKDFTKSSLFFLTETNDMPKAEFKKEFEIPNLLN